MTVNQNKLSGTAKGLAVLYLFSIGYAIFTQRFFFVDGAHFFLKILEEKSFIYSDDFARHHAHYATQFIIVILIKVFHVRNLDILSYAFGLGLYLPQLVSLLLCYRITRGKGMYSMLFPIIGLFGITMNLSFAIVHESHVISNIFWPILFYILLKDEYDWKDTAILFVLGLVFIRSYEIASILGIILITFLVLIMREKWDKAAIKTRIMWIILLVFFATAVAIAAYSTIYPRCPDNKAGFFSSASFILKHWPALLSFVYIVLIALCIFVPKMTKTILFACITVLIIIATFLTSLIPVMMPDHTMPALHYHIRSILTYMLPFVAILSYLVIRNIILVPEFAWRKISFLVSLLVAGQITWQILATSQWAGYREIFKGELARHNVGIIHFEDTMLKNERMGMQLIRPMTWPWSNPTLSILWSNNKDVKTMVVNPPVSWEPFNPLDVNALPRVEEYGFSFKKYKDALQ